MRVSVVIPVFRNEESLAPLVQRLTALSQSLEDSIQLEGVFVDDGSDDGSWQVLLELATTMPLDMKLMRLSRNFGQVGAIYAGLEAAAGDVVVVLSADLQDPPEMIRDMIKSFLDGSEIVVAFRRERHDSLPVRLASRAAYGIARKTNPRIPQGGFDYVLMSARARDHLCRFKGRHRFFQGDVLWMGFSTCFLPYERQERPHGQSGWTLSKKWKYFVDLTLDGSYYPIQLLSRVGLIFAVVGLIYAAVIAGSWLLSRTPFPGWAPIMVTLLVTGGVIMVMLGVIGEYLWRIYDEVRGKPMYIVEETEETHT